MSFWTGNQGGIYIQSTLHRGLNTQVPVKGRLVSVEIFIGDYQPIFPSFEKILSFQDYCLGVLGPRFIKSIKQESSKTGLLDFI
jgi:hypothetical protein